MEYDYKNTLLSTLKDQISKTRDSMLSVHVMTVYVLLAFVKYSKSFPSCTNAPLVRDIFSPVEQDRRAASWYFLWNESYTVMVLSDSLAI